MSDFSLFLFARPSLSEGMGRLFDFGDTLSEYNNSPNTQEADTNALWSDWLAVGDDIHGSMTEQQRLLER